MARRISERVSERSEIAGAKAATNLILVYLRSIFGKGFPVDDVVVQFPLDNINAAAQEVAENAIRNYVRKHAPEADDGWAAINSGDYVLEAAIDDVYRRKAL